MQALPIDPARDATKDPHLSSPFVPLEGVLNCRALPIPGLSTAPSWKSPNTAPKIRLLRSGDISCITPLGITQLRSYGIRKIFDLRSASEIAESQTSVAVIEGVDIVNARMLQDPPMSSGTDTSGNGGGDVDFRANDYKRKMYAEFREDELEAFMSFYKRSLEEGREAIATILRGLITEDEGILFHCAGGKDRTGVLSALILSIAGVDDSIIVEDYALTTVGYEPYSDALLSRFEKDAAFQAEREGALKMFSSRPETMRAFLVLLREKYGGAECYARDVAGLTQDEINAVKRNLT